VIIITHQTTPMIILFNFPNIWIIYQQEIYKNIYKNKKNYDESN